MMVCSEVSFGISCLLTFHATFVILVNIYIYWHKCSKSQKVGVAARIVIYRSIGHYHV